MSGRWRWVTGRVTAVLVLLAAVGLTALVFLTSPEQPEASPTDGLPAGKQSTRVTELADQFASARADAAVVVFERRDAPLTGASPVPHAPPWLAHPLPEMAFSTTQGERTR